MSSRSVKIDDGHATPSSLALLTSSWTRAALTGPDESSSRYAISIYAIKERTLLLAMPWARNAKGNEIVLTMKKQ